jgi:PAS domain S-box-containing protein
LPSELTEQVRSDMFSQASQEKTYISPVYFDNVTNEPLVIMAAPVTDVFGDFKGVLLAEVNLKFMWDLVDSIKIGNNGLAYVVDRKGNLIAFGDTSRVLKGENVIHLKGVNDFVKSKELLLKNNAEISKGIQGNNVVANYVPLGTPDWAVVVELPAQEAYAGLIQLLELSAGVVLMSFFLAIAISVYLSKRITEPIIKLRNAAIEIGKGDLDTKIDIKSDNEIADLSSAFNNMTGELQKTTISKQTLQTILNSMPYGSILIDMDKKILNLNRAALIMMGYESEEQISGLICNIMCSAQHGECPIIDLKQEIDKSEKILITKDLRHIPILKTVVPIKLGDRQVLLEAFVDITERKQATEKLKASEKKYSTLVEKGNDGIVIIQDHLLKFINPIMAEISGFSMNEVIDKPFIDFVASPFKELINDTYEKRIAGEEISNKYEAELISKYGKTIPVEINASLIEYEGKPADMAIIRDITDRKATEKEIKKSLKEKEILLSEIYHRVKNNMQIIISLLRLQSRYVKEEKYREMFKESQNRIISMSLVHEKLYQSEDLTRIDFNEYIGDLIKGLFQSHGANKGNIVLKIDVKTILLGIDHAIPCGLIINELVTNSLKHAFRDGRNGEIKVVLHPTEENMIELAVGDNGIGIPEDMDFKQTKTFGLHLVTMLAENQLHGDITLNRSKGTEFIIKFKKVK